MVNNLENNFDVLIVGGGIIGMLTARSLQSEGLSVAIVEKGKLGGAATWAAGGILSPLNPWQKNSATQSLIKEGRQNFPALIHELKQETAIDSELLQSGMLVLDLDEKQQALNWAKHNNEALEVLTAQSLLEHEANISTKFDEALYLPNITQVRPPKLISALQQSLLQRKVKICENTFVENFLIEDNTVKGLATRNEKLYAEKIIICSGAWTKSLIQAGTSIDPEIDIEPVRGQMLLYKLPEKILSHIILKEKSYLIPRQDGHILCGSTVEHVGFENDVTQEARQSLQTTAHELMPTLEKLEPIKQWSALRPGTQRDTPYICKHPVIEGLYLNSGHYRYGIIMSIASARIMTKLVSDSLNPSQITAFA